MPFLNISTRMHFSRSDKYLPNLTNMTDVGLVVHIKFKKNLVKVFLEV